MKDVLAQTRIFVGRMIFAQAEGSSTAEFFNLTSSSTVTCWPLASLPTTSLLSFACPRMLTLLASHVAGPGLRGTVTNGAAGAFFFVAAFRSDFFLAAFLAGALVVAAFVALAAGASMGGEAGGMVSVLATQQGETRI